MSSERSKFILRVSTNYARLLCMVSMGILLVPLVLEGTTEIGFGLWGMLGATAGFGDMFKEIVQTSMNRELGDAYHREDDTYFKKVINSAYIVSLSSTLFGVMIYAVIYLCIPLLNIEPEWAQTARTIVIFQGASSAVAIAAAPLFNLYIVSERMARYNAWLVLERFSYLLAAIIWIVLVPMDDPKETLLRFAMTGASIAVLVVCSAAIMMLCIDRRTIPKLSLADRVEMKKIVVTSGWNGVVSAALNLHIRLDQLLVNIWFGLAGNAVFVAAVRLSSYIRMVTIGMTDGLDVVAARMTSQKQDTKLTSLLPRITKLHALVAIPAATVVYMYAPYLLDYWIGKQLSPDQLQRCITTVRILIVGMCARSIADGWVRVLYGAGYIKRYAPVILLGGVLNPVTACVLYLLMPAELVPGSLWADVNAPAIAFASIFMTAHLLWLPRVVQRCVDVRPSALLKPIVRPALMGICIIASGYTLINTLGVESLLMLAVNIATMGALCVAFFVTFGADKDDRVILGSLVGAVLRKLGISRAQGQ
jgi:O-antigen/teichoic acid export membrane protein